jgi:hypothetical protein
MASKKQGSTSKNTAVAAAPMAPAAPAVPARTASPSPANLALQCSVRGDGSAEVVLAYEGPLAARDEVLARAGTRRNGGHAWADVQDVRLRRDAAGRWVGAIPVRPGAPLDAVQLAFHAGGEWDNGGAAPLGYYEWSLRERQVVVR